MNLSRYLKEASNKQQISFANNLPAQITIEAQSPTEIPWLAGLFPGGTQGTKTNYARGISNYLLSQGGPFSGISGMLVGMKADKAAKDNQEIAQAAANKQALLDKIANWWREDEIDSRKRGYALEDRKAAEDFDLNKLNIQQDYDAKKDQRQRGYNIEDRDAKQNMAIFLKNMELSGKSEEKSEYEKELEKQRAKQYAQLSGDIADGEAGLETLSESINEALKLNKVARSGAGANARQSLGRFFGGGEQTTAGAKLKGIMQNQLVGQLKKIFGGQISEGEREYLNKLYGADLSMAEGEREALIRNVHEAAINKVNRDRGAFNSLFGNKKQPIEDPSALQNYNQKYGL